MKTVQLNRLTRRILTVLWFATAWLFGSLHAAPAGPFTNSVDLVSFDFDGDDSIDAKYRLSAVIVSGDQPYYSVVFYLGGETHLRFVRATKTRTDFVEGQAVSSANAIYQNGGGGNTVGFNTFNNSYNPLNLVWEYFDQSQGAFDAFSTNKTEVFVGFRLTSLELGTKHHGWLHFTRPNTAFTTPFDLAGYDWNPLPNEPIAAGQPPVIPLLPEVTAGGLKLTWPAPVAGWVLETSNQLGAAAEWVPVPDVSATEVLLPPPEGTRFYRLRRP